MRNKYYRQKLPLLICVCFLGACLNESSADKRSDILVGGPSVETFMPEQVRIIFKRSCESCHGVDGRGIAGIAPNLKRSNRRSVQEWEKFLRNPHRVHPASQKPPVWLDEEEVRTMAEYLFHVGATASLRSRPRDMQSQGKN